MELLIETLKLVKPEVSIEDMLASKDLYGEGLIDSLDILSIIEEINAAFDIEIGGDELSRKDFMSVDSIYALVQRHVAL